MKNNSPMTIEEKVKLLDSIAECIASLNEPNRETLFSLAKDSQKISDFTKFNKSRMVKIKKRTDKKNLLSERNLKMNKRLKAAREAAGKTQAEVAKLVGMSERGYRRIENSASYAGVALSIARVLNTTVEQIFSLTEDAKLTDA